MISTTALAPASTPSANSRFSTASGTYGMSSLAFTASASCFSSNVIAVFTTASLVGTVVVIGWLVGIVWPLVSSTESVESVMHLAETGLHFVTELRVGVLHPIHNQDHLGLC